MPGRIYPLSPVLGLPPNGMNFIPDTTERVRMGTLVAAINDYWGHGEYLYAKASGTINAYSVVKITSAYDSTLKRWGIIATAVPNTANTAHTVAVACTAYTDGQFGWFQITGVTPVWSSASIAADTGFGIVAAGQAGAVAAGKSILGGRVVAAATSTVVKASLSGVSGATTIQVSNLDGIIIGAAVTGTGIGVSALVSAVSDDGRTVTVSVANSAAVTGNITFTYNDGTNYFNVVYVDRPQVQGPIT